MQKKGSHWWCKLLKCCEVYENGLDGFKIICREWWGMGGM